LVALGAALWATDSLFRSSVAHSYPALVVVLMNHLLLLPVALLLGYRHRAELTRLSWAQWLSVTIIGGGGSVAATVAFTLAFSRATNYSVPVLMQKLQPCFALVLARVILKESLPRYFGWLALLGIGGAYLLSFGLRGSWESLASEDLGVVGYSLLAAATWGACTVFGRLALRGLSFPAVTAARFILGSACAVVALGIFTPDAIKEVAKLGTISAGDARAFAGMAYLSGLLPMLIYYRGLQTTPASVATLCELSFPLVAVILNWIWLGSALNLGQLLGAALVVTAITLVSLPKVRAAS